MNLHRLKAAVFGVLALALWLMPASVVRAQNLGGISTAAIEWEKAGDISSVSDGGSVASWPAANGQAMAQSVSGQQPTLHTTGGPNGQPYVSFSGTQALYTNALTSSAGSYDIFAVQRFKTTSTGSWTVDSATGRVLFYAYEDTPAGAGFYEGGFNSVGDTSGSVNTWAVIEWKMDAGASTGTVYVNGTAVGSAAYSAISLGGATAIGNAEDTATGASSTSKAAGDLSEIAIWNTLLVLSDRNGVGHALGVKYGIATAYTVPAVFAADDSHIRYTGAFHVASGLAKTINSGGQVDLAITGGDACTLNFDTSGDAANCIPLIKYSVDGGAVSSAVAAAASVPLTIGTTTGAHTIRWWVDGLYEGTGGFPGTVNQWSSQQAALTFTGVTLSSGSTLTTLAASPGYYEFIGDSITASVRILGLGTTGTQGYSDQYAMDSVSAWPQRVASFFGVFPSVRGFGGTGVAIGGSGSVPATGSNFPYAYSGVSYTPATNPAAIVILLGTNDKGNSISVSAFQSAYAALITQIRAARGSTTSIFCVAPMAFDATWKNALQATVIAASDAHVYFIDASGTNALDMTNGANSSDGLHPTVAGDILLASYLEGHMNQALRPVNRSRSASRTRVIYQ